MIWCVIGAVIGIFIAIIGALAEAGRKSELERQAEERRQNNKRLQKQLAKSWKRPKWPQTVNPPSPPPGMGMANLDHIDSSMAVLEMEVRFHDIDNTVFMLKMDKTLIGIAENIIKQVDITEQTLANPNTVIDPAYRQAFEAKADAVRKFITTAGLQ